MTGYKHRARERAIRDTAQDRINTLYTSLVARDRQTRSATARAEQVAAELAEAEATITRLRAESRRVSRAHIVRCTGCGDWVPYRATCTVCTIIDQLAADHATAEAAAWKERKAA